ncbi:glycoside hydrolase family 43 protein [Planctomicrobium piriforme]|uniref:Arabinosidase BT-3657-like N-terminal domain-containing protein n=1 Tax=Planctomicrobium piriforme TaxID=1576369 RepID=A0A1I3NFL1_9PLAN|nr:glycoside hydrolase family 43 protein [Planctomicrobium piriforme]SFJ08128.1 hypothetical protein SAMN05421753_11586 [Planctomicrobium piriforme]
MPIHFGSNIRALLLALGFLWGLTGSLVAEEKPPAPANSGPFVFAYFNTGNAGESQGLQYAWSRDGYKWTALASPNGTFLKPEVGGKLLRDPSIVQAPDGIFHMVWTTDWFRHGIGSSYSKDLLHWSPQEYLDVMQDFPGTVNCWAPEIFYDAPSQTYLIYWASTIPGKFPDTEPTGEEFKQFGTRASHRIYVTTTQDFKKFTPTQLLYDNGYNAIDAFIVADPEHSRYVMIIKDETAYPTAKKNLRLAFAKTPLGPWSPSTTPFSPDWVEGASVLKVGNEWLVYYDAYTRHRYEGQKTTDLENWQSITDKLTMPTGMRHGTPLPVTEVILQGLLSSSKAP